MRKAKEVYNGKAKYAKEGIECFVCKKWLKKGVRKANQFLCCNDDSRDLTECQRTYYKNKRAEIAKLKPKPEYGYVICDVCRTKVKKTDPLQKRCTSGIKDVLSECQKEGMRRNTRKSPDEREQRFANIPTKKRLCLKCEQKFDSISPYNRICEPCGIENDELQVSEYRVHTPDNGNAGSQDNRRISRFVDDVDVNDIFYG